MFKHILLPTDGTPASLKAGHVAVELAKRCGARLSILHVIEPNAPHPHSGNAGIGTEIEWITEMQVRSEGYLAQIEEIAGVHAVACTSSHVTRGSPYLAIEEFATLHKCDLIVMGSHGKHGLQRLILGSQTQKVLLTTRFPVLICPPFPLVDGDPTA